MKKLKFNIFIYKLIGLFILGAFIIYLQCSYFDVPKYGDLPAIIFLLIIEGIYLLLPYVFDKVFASITMFLYTLYYLLQETYFAFFKQYILLKTAFDMFNEAKDYSGEFFKYFTFKEIITVILLVLAIVLICIIKKRKKYNKTIKLVYIVIALLLLIISLLLINKNNYKLDDSYLDPFNTSYVESDKYIYEKMPSSEEFVKMFGIEEFLIKDFNQNVLGNNDVSKKELEEIKTFLNENLPYMTNEYTGIFEGKQIIVIEAESLNMAAINKDLTPTLYRLMNEGFNFSNFLAPTLPGSTSDAEVMINTSLVPINKGEITSHKYYDNYYPTTLAKGFLSAGYNTTSVYHSGYFLYYNRDKFFPNLGYKEFFGPTELVIEQGSSDLEIVKPLTYINIDMDKTFTFWITYSGHQPYSPESIYSEGNDNTKQEYEQYLQIVKDYYPNLNEEAQVYIAKNISLDKALEFLITNYDIANKLDDLVLVIYGDHYVKGTFDEDNIYENTGSTFEDTPLIIYNSAIKGKEIIKHCTDIDVLPTLFNMFNISYDKSTILGNDIFDERYHGFSFNRNWEIMTDDYNYSISEGFSDLKIDEEVAKKEVERYIKYQEISNNIFVSNYFKEDE